MKKNDYILGFMLGLVLIAAFAFMGRGFGAMGAVSATVGITVQTIAPTAADSYPAFHEYREAHWWQEWVVVEMLGVALGAAGALAVYRTRITPSIERGPRCTPKWRLAAAGCGGLVMAIGAHLGSGCTSSQILSGGAVLNAGSWLFMVLVFVGAYATAPLVRRMWQ